MIVEVVISKTDDNRVKMELHGGAEGRITFSDHEALVAFTRDCVKYVVEQRILAGKLS